VYIRCDEWHSGGCAEVLFWGILAIATFGIALIIPLLLFRNTGDRKCVAVCRRCGHITRVN